MSSSVSTAQTQIGRLRDHEGTPLRVAFIVGQLRMGGAQRQLLYLTQGLDRRRFEPVVLTLRQGDPFATVLRDAGIETVELGYRGRLDLGIVGRIQREIERRRIQVACPYLWPATLWGYLALRRARVSRWIASERSSGASYDPRLVVALESRILARAPALVAISSASRDFAVTRGVNPQRIRIIPIGVPVPRPVKTTAAVRAELGIPPDAPVIGCIARFGPQKDHPTLLRAAARVSQRVPRAELVLVGEGQLQANVERLGVHLGIGNRIHFVGMTLHPADYLNMFDVAVLASNREEGCSNFLVEAALLEKPVVATRVGGIPETVRDGETGWLVPPEDPVAMADAIVDALGDRARATSVGAAGAQWARERFPLPAMIGAWEQVLSAGGTRAPRPPEVPVA